MNTVLISSYIILLIAVALGLAKFKAFATSAGLVDIPNQRSSHQITKPRGGGVVIIAGWFAWMLFACLTHMVSLKLLLALTPSVLLLSVVGFCDDRYTIAARWRFAAQLIAVALFLSQLGLLSQFHVGSIHFSLGFFGSIFAAIALLWSTNLFNFMDGTDGIAGVEAVTVFGFGAVLFYFHGAYALSFICASLCFSVGGFLFWNWPPAKIFMGDVGSTSLGFLIVAMALLGQKLYDISLIPWIIVYAVFLLDATTTLIRRMLRGEKWTQAHKSHAYQRLHQAGYSHQQVLFFVIMINVALVLIASLVALKA